MTEPTAPAPRRKKTPWWLPVVVIVGAAPAVIAVIIFGVIVRYSVAHDEESCPYTLGASRSLREGLEVREDTRQCMDDVRDHRWVVVRDGFPDRSLGNLPLMGDTAEFVWEARLEEDRVIVDVTVPERGDLTFREPDVDAEGAVMDERAIDALIETWFGPTGVPTAAQQETWWRKDPALDAALRERFGGEVATRSGRRSFDDWASTPRGALALVLLLDQLPRNLYRDTPRSFASDEKARSVARAALTAGHDLHLPAHQRAFLVMPFMHSEALADQDAGIAYFDALAAAAEHPKDVKSFADFGRRHRDIVARFGRFPHRNAILGRPSTEEELAFLKTPGSSF